MKDDWFVIMYKFENGEELKQEFLDFFADIVIDTPVESDNVLIVETNEDDLTDLMDVVDAFVEGSPVEMEVYSMKVDRDSVFQEI